MRRKKACVCILIVIFVFTACSNKNEVVSYDRSDEANYALSFFGNKHEAANVEVIEEILTDYMEENKEVTIFYESIKGDEYFTALKNREQAGKLDDIFMVNHDTMLEFSKNESLADLTELVENVPFSESVKTQMKSLDGKIYWVPTIVSAFGLYCNMELLEKHGQKVPKTLGEWKAVCEYFVSHNITPIIANNDISLKTLAIAKGFYPLYKEGIQVEVFENINKGEEKLSTYLSEGFTLVKEFCTKGYIDAEKSLETKKTSDDLEEFVKGESPFMLTGAWAAGRVKNMNPNFTFKVVPYPILENGSVLVINPDVRLSVSAKGKNIEIAKDFVSYFLKEENIWRFANNQSSFIPLDNKSKPSLNEIQDIVTSYQTQTCVIGSDSYIQFPIWDITMNVSRKLLKNEDMTELMQWMDEQVINAKE